MEGTLTLHSTAAVIFADVPEYINLMQASFAATALH
jgi:hypothetical protein